MSVSTVEMTNDEIVATLEKAAREGADIYDTAVNAGMKAAAELESGRWTIGDLAALVGKKYGQDLIGDFATAINMEKARVKEYRTVCSFYEKSARADFLAGAPSVTDSHMRDAMRLKDFEEAMSFLDEVAANSWTVEQARLELQRRLGKEEPPVKLADITTLSYEVDLKDHALTFHIAPHIGLSVLKDLARQRDDRKPLRIVLYEGK